MDNDKEIVNPLDFLEDYIEDQPDRVSGGRDESQPPKRGRGIFITGTDTGVGKTIATCVLGTLLKSRKLDVGVMKPVQCGGHDAQFLKEFLEVEDTIREVNPYFAREPLSPHIAFPRAKQTIDIEHIIDTFHKIQYRHDITLVEGAGGLFVPIKPQYRVADLIKEMKLDIVIVARLGLGTINHTLLTIHQARELGIPVLGVIFSTPNRGEGGIPERTNPSSIQKEANIPILGTIPYLRQSEPKNFVGEILRTCHSAINLEPLLTAKPAATEQTADKRQLESWDKKYVWHPFTQMQDWMRSDPLIIDQAKGSYLIDAKGRQYIDGVSSLWVNIHGHRKEHIDQAIKNQINKVSHSTFLGLSNTPAVELAKKLVDISPRGLDKVFYSDNGSTAVEVAIKMAYQYWQNTGKKRKTRIARLTNAYHGDTLGCVSAGGIDLFHKIFKEITFKTLEIKFPDFYRAPRGKKYPEYGSECVDKMEELFKRSHGVIAALVIEPIVQAAAGIIVWPEGLLKQVNNICQRYQIFLIADEVATGFGRTGKMFACEHENVSPDFLCLAKGMTGGYLPLAATLTTKRIFDGFCYPYSDQKTFFHGHTYTGNPIGCAAGLANLEVFENEQVLQKLQPKIKYLSSKLQMFYNLRSVGHVRQKGFMVGIELVREKRAQTPYHWKDQIGDKVCQEVRKKGVILRPLGDVIVLMPPLSIGKNDLNHILGTTYEAIRSVTEGGQSRSPGRERSRVRRSRHARRNPRKV